MVGRQITWHRRKYDDDVVWTAKTHPDHRWWRHNVDLSFTLESGRQFALVNRNAVLIVRKCEEGKKVANKEIMRREFDNSWQAKNLIDALIFTAGLLFEKTPHMAEPWFLEQLGQYLGADYPVQPDSLSKVHNPKGYPL